MRPARASARHAGGNAFYVAGPRYNFALSCMHIEGFLYFVLARCARVLLLLRWSYSLLGVKKIRPSYA